LSPDGRKRVPVNPKVELGISHKFDT
jgi:hypothetical protein